jgi:hypothetical protein
VASSCEYGDEPSGSGATELVNYRENVFEILTVVQLFRESHVSYGIRKQITVFITAVINVIIERLTLLLRIREVPDSNLGFPEVFCAFPQWLQTILG